MGPEQPDELAGAPGPGGADAGDPHDADDLEIEGEEEAEEEEAENDGEEEEREEGLESVTIEITGLSLYTNHGVSEAEREVGQRLVLDLRLDVGETDATVTDSIEDTVDYAEVCQLVALIAQQRSHKTLERLCSTIADRLLADYDLEGVWVKAAKPEPPIALTVDEVSVEVWREAEG
jgi:dihydroneopterin aldolase